MAPPLKLTPDVEHRVCTLIRAGNTIDVAAVIIGCSPSGIYAWQRRDPGFRQAVAQARALAEVDGVTQLQKASRAGSWRATAALLERRFPERWAPPTRRL